MNAFPRLRAGEVSDEEVLRAIRSVPPHYVVGPQVASTGSSPANAPRQGRTTETIVGQAHGKYYEACQNGVLFGACDQASGVAVVATISTTSILSLYNPGGSGKRLAVKRVAVGYFSGTFGNAGSLIQHCVNNTAGQTAPSSGTLLTSTCMDVGNQQGSVGVCRVASTVVTPVAIYPALFIPINYISIATILGPASDQDLDGMIVVEPGCSYQLQSTGTASGATSPKVTVAVVWEEVPVVS